jgi:outer membrane protein assembly factor BamB
VKWLLVGVAVAVVAVAGAGVAYYLVKKHEGRNIRGSSSIEFVTSTAPKPRPKPKRNGIVWPMYGYDASRSHLGPSKLRPPFRKLWFFGARSLLEFPPAIGFRRLFFTNNAGVTFAISTRSGGRAWRVGSGRCVASSPALSGRLVFQAFLNKRPCNRSESGLNGEVVAFYVGSGGIRWVKRIGPTESSPLIAEGRVFVGDWNGKVYAFNANTGRLKWTYRTGGKVKGGLAYAAGRVYLGSYDHHVYALRARDGKLVWRASAQARFGSSATFYSTPAVAYGRVYIGGTDGKVYSYGASSGKLRWSHSTGGYVYASPAIWNRLVLAGSYSGDFYAFDAATGDVRWRFHANGPISGSATVVAGIVYFATLKGRTYALNAKTGKLVWQFPDGEYSPVVADSKRVYLVGRARIYGLMERRKR